MWRWVLRPINLLVEPIVKPQRQNSQKMEESPNPEASNPQSTNDNALAAAASNPDLCSSQSEILSICSEAGIDYRPTEAGNVFSHPISEVRQAIAHFWRRGGHEKISNPQGWLIECLRRRWWEDATDVGSYYSANSPIANRLLQQWSNAGCPLGTVITDV